MNKQSDVNIQEKQPRDDRLNYVLIGAACMFVIAAVAVGAIWFSGGFSNQGNAEKLFEGSGFASPEEAVRAYLEGYKKIDIEEMLSAFAIETFVSNYNFDVQVLNNVSFSNILNVNLAYPNSSRLLTRDNIYQRLFQLEKDIADQVMGYTETDFSGLNSDDFAEMDQQVLIDTIVGMFPVEEDFEALPSLSIVKFLEPGEIGIDNSYTEPSVKEYIDMATEAYGVDELLDVAVACDIGGKDYYLTFTAYRYVNTWFLGEVGGTIGMSLPDGEQIIKGFYKRTR